MIKKSDPIYLAGHKGLLGSAIYRKLIENGYKNIITRTDLQLDLIDQKTLKFIKTLKPRLIIIASLYKIKLTSICCQFIDNNLMIQNNMYSFGF